MLQERSVKQGWAAASLWGVCLQASPSVDTLQLVAWAHITNQ